MEIGRGGLLDVGRLVVISMLLLFSVPTLGAYVATHGPAGEASAATSDNRPGGMTVITFDGAGPGAIVAYDRLGRATYVNATYDYYHDVDPSPAGHRTVMYVASTFNVSAPNRSACRSVPCMQNVVERVNLSTGNTTRLHTVVEPAVGSSQIHDVDRVNDSVLLVGDIGPPDRVYMVNTTTDRVIWEWRVERAFEPGSGGHYPGDWTHLNEVQHLGDGRVMVGLRNHDQVVFVEPGRGLLDDWTLGSDGDHATLYEQHNPDYIPRRRGGPAVVVADSENNRVVEYQRRHGTWTRTWHWRDPYLQWPRDADRLPGGNTLIVDSYGGRVFEVAPDGDIVWTLHVPDGGYDVERLGTGDESARGRSAVALNYTSRGAAFGRWGRNVLDVLSFHLVSIVPSLVLHGLLFVLPPWVPPIGAALMLGQSLIVVGWGTTEAIVAVRS